MSAYPETMSASLERLEDLLRYYHAEAGHMDPIVEMSFKRGILGRYRDCLADGEREAANALVTRYRVGELAPA